jgi:membrane protein implicated in regulation of membrane protease activity
MADGVSYLIGSLLLLLVVVNLAMDAAGLALVALERLVRYLQRVCFGIDRPRAGAETLVGKRGRIHSPFVECEDGGQLQGYVLIDGELGLAQCGSGYRDLDRGSAVGVTAREGLVLRVEPVEDHNAGDDTK